MNYIQVRNNNNIIAANDSETASMGLMVTSDGGGEVCDGRISSFK